MRDPNLFEVRFYHPPPFALSGKRMVSKGGWRSPGAGSGNSTKNTAGILWILDAFCLICPLEVSED